MDGMDLSKIPAADPPPGVTPNFDNPEGSKFAIYSVSIALCSSATLVLLLRLYTRLFILRISGLDDWCCVMGQICAWIFAILSLINIRNGYGYHVWDLTLDKITPFKQYDLAEEGIYALGVWFVKTSILLFYLRLSPEKRFRQMTFVIMGFVAIYSLLSIFIFTMGCIPVQAMWDVTRMDGAKCADAFDFVYANASFNVLSDILTLVLPIKLCWSLQTTVRQRILLMIVFGTGSFACVVAVLRIVTMMPYIHSNDFTHFKVTLANWCMIEINVGIICASLPTMRPLLMRLFPRVFSTAGRSDNSPKGSGGSYSLKPKKKIRNWDHLTTVEGTQATTHEPEPEQDNPSDSQHIVKTEYEQTEESEDSQGISKSTHYSVTYNPDRDHV